MAYQHFGKYNVQPMRPPRLHRPQPVRHGTRDWDTLLVPGQRGVCQGRGSFCHCPFPCIPHRTAQDATSHSQPAFQSKTHPAQRFPGAFLSSWVSARGVPAAGRGGQCPGARRFPAALAALGRWHSTGARAGWEPHRAPAGHSLTDRETRTAG